MICYIKQLPLLCFFDKTFLINSLKIVLKYQSSVDRTLNVLTAAANCSKAYLTQSGIVPGNLHAVNSLNQIRAVGMFCFLLSKQVNCKLEILKIN